MSYVSKLWQYVENVRPIYPQPQKKRTTKTFKIILIDFCLGQNCLCTIDFWLENWLKTQNHSSVTFIYVQMAWFIPLGCEQQSAYFPGLLIKNQGVIENLEQNRSESRNIRTVASFGVAVQDCFFRMLLHISDYRFPGSHKFFLDFSVENC